MMSAAVLFGMPVAQSETPDWILPIARSQSPLPGDSAAPAPPNSAQSAEDRNHIGLLQGELAGVPEQVWFASTAQELEERLFVLRPSHVQTRDFLRRLLIAEVSPPALTAPDQWLLTRIDMLLHLGALEEAYALLLEAGVNTTETLNRWFAISLLLRHDLGACSLVTAMQALEIRPAAKLFCLLRAHQFHAAETLLEGMPGASDEASDEGANSAWPGGPDQALMARFMAPEEAEGLPLPPIHPPLDPLQFVMREGLGVYHTRRGLPLAYHHFDVLGHGSWLERLRASERLATAHAIPVAQLFALYRERRAAASGGVWARVKAVQAFDEAMQQGEADAALEAFGALYHALAQAGLLHATSEPARDLLKGIKPGTVLPIELLNALALDRRSAEAFHPWLKAAESAETTASKRHYLALMRALWRRDLSGLQRLKPQTSYEAAIIAALTREAPSSALYTRRLAEGQVGAVLLDALRLYEAGVTGDPRDLQLGLYLIAQAGFVEEARSMAIEALILGSGRHASGGQ